MSDRIDFQQAADRYSSSIAKDIILSLITCGIYYLFWQERQMKAMNYLLEEDKFSFIKWFFLSIITCGIYHIYYEYVFGQSVIEAQQKHGRPVSSYLHLLSVGLALFGLNIVADAIQQEELNKLFRR